MRGTGKRTVILATEDGPRTTDSQLYLYVGRKDRSSSDPLRRNGLDNGQAVRVRVRRRARRREPDLQGDTVHGSWLEIVECRRAERRRRPRRRADAAGAFGFVRIEDGEFRPNAKREFWFNATGDQAKRNEADPHTNELGRHLPAALRPGEPAGGRAHHPGLQRGPADRRAGRAARSRQRRPSRSGRSSINEDGTAGSRAAEGTTGSRDDMDRRNRDGSIWMVPLATAGNPATFRRVAELVGRSEGGRDGIITVDERGNHGGVWETSGIVGPRTRSAGARSCSTCRRTRPRRRRAASR